MRKRLARDAEPRFAYLYAVARHSLGDRGAALATLRDAVERWPWDFDLRAVLVIYLDDPKLPEVAGHLRTLGRIAPDSPRFQALRARYGQGSKRSRGLPGGQAGRRVRHACSHPPP